MTNAKPRVALVVGILCISVFPVLIKLELASGLISAFYRMAIAFLLLLPYMLFTKKFKLPKKETLILAVICGILFSTDVALWNIAIQESSATQATLLTNLSPLWVGIFSYVFLKIKPATNFWIGTLVAFFGMAMLVGFHFFITLNFDRAFVLALLSGIVYAMYMLVSKKALSDMDVLSFMLISLFTSTVYLALVGYWNQESFYGFTNKGWLVLFIQGAVCQLAAWLSISYATQHMRPTRISLSLLAQAILTAILAWLFLDEKITLNRIVGGIVLLLGIRITFYTKTLGAKKQDH
ncbi:DMT family transporter [Flavobacterium crassostreae]|uniref:EamA domain-containing protein n=1 Tax=Flavobacterium crassostreae TaxID=1763534 RepID=A0A1B9E0B3_9FLAO|nr:DMT family transporter [Flavobacterium crassostreae]OCB75385.1 hypothetical protein LPBF_08300 [Flavobacterium crassostreae]